MTRGVRPRRIYRPPATQHMCDGLKCVECGRVHKSKLVDVRAIGKSNWRRRECQCGARWTTFEIRTESLPNVTLERSE